MTKYKRLTPVHPYHVRLEVQNTSTTSPGFLHPSQAVTPRRKTPTNRTHHCLPPTPRQSPDPTPQRPARKRSTSLHHPGPRATGSLTEISPTAAVHSSRSRADTRNRTSREKGSGGTPVDFTCSTQPTTTVTVKIAVHGRRSPTTGHERDRRGTILSHDFRTPETGVRGRIDK